MNRTTGTYWLCLENTTFVALQENKALLYNTLNGKHIETFSFQDILLINQLHEKKNLGVVKIPANDTKKELIINGIEKGIFSLKIYNEHEKKPIRLMPVPNIQQNVDRYKKEHFVGDSILNYLTEITIYLNNTCNKNCSFCKNAYKQFTCCTANNHNLLSLNRTTLKMLASQITHAPLNTINITGGNISNNLLINKLQNLFSIKKHAIHYWIHYKNFTPKQPDVFYDILIDFPENHKQLLSCVQNKKKENFCCHFMIQRAEDIKKAWQIIRTYEIKQYKFYPLYNHNNISFFEKHVFLNKKTILEKNINQRKLFRNQFLNSNHFGSLVIFSDGSVCASPNTAVLGNINHDSILKIIDKELKDNTAWRKTRNIVEPCNKCLYNVICPPLSNYEPVLHRNNLCFLK